MRTVHRAMAVLLLAGPLTVGLAGFAAADPLLPGTARDSDVLQHLDTPELPTAPQTTSTPPVIDLTWLSPLTDVLFAGPAVSPEQHT